jgi:hypothetical protein
LKQDLEKHRQAPERYAKVKWNIEKALQHKQKPINKTPGIKKATKTGMDI